MNQSLLIIGAGIEACEGIKIAREMGLKLIIADGDPHAPGLKMADHPFIISTYDGNQIAFLAWNLVQSGIPIDGVISMCADVPLSVAKVAKKLGLSGLSLPTANLVADKLLMKDRLQEMSIPIPQYKQIFFPTEMETFADQTGVPFIIKPVDSRGARGVQLLDKPYQYTQAFELAKKESPTGRVMLEEYLPGPQISTETLIDDGTCYTLGFADRNYEWLEKTKPYIIENGGDSPSQLSESEQLDITTTAEKAALALGITSGVAKGDMVLTAQGAKVIEIAGRLSGGYFSTTQIPLATDVNFVKQAILLALGKHLDPSNLSPKQKYGVAIRYLNLKPGKIKSVSGLEQAKNSPGVAMFSSNIKAGDNISALANHTQRMGFVITRAKNKKQAVDWAQNALNKIRVYYFD